NMLHLRSALILLILSIGVMRGAETAPPSEEMKHILRDRLTGPYDLRLDGLTKLDWTPAKLQELQKKVPIEIYRVPYPKGVADYFGYSIYRVKSDNRFLILRTGGIAGVFQLYSSVAE